MDDLIGRLWAESPLCVTREAFEQSLAGWTVEPVVQGEALIGAFLVKGPELHFEKFDRTAVTRAHLHRLRDLIQEHGYAVTRTPKADTRMLKFNARLGFRPIGEDGEYIQLRIDAIRGESKCQ
jgi:hypothetical protein